MKVSTFEMEKSPENIVIIVHKKKWNCTTKKKNETKRKREWVSSRFFLSIFPLKRLPLDEVYFLIKSLWKIDIFHYSE